jgi:hypothetical protein
MKNLDSLSRETLLRIIEELDVLLEEEKETSQFLMRHIGNKKSKSNEEQEIIRGARLNKDEQPKEE